jgi:2-deoxy-D-gluconate 3-dehydrogenase
LTTDPFSLVGRRALVTGANTGIGRGIAEALAAAGAFVVLAGRSPMDETMAAIAAAGGTAAPLRLELAEVTNPEGAGAAMDAAAVAAGGTIDVLVNNAGIIRRADAVDVTEADWDAVMDSNLKSAFFLAQAFARHLFAEPGRTGKVINVASLLAFQGGIRIAAYTSSKSGLAGLTRLLACEWAGKGINVNAIAPGYTETNNTEALRADAERFADILKRIPAGRWAKPADFGGAAVFLASEASDYVHGAVLPVDGGWLAR